jgi:hypothetical protein
MQMACQLHRHRHQPLLQPMHRDLPLLVQTRMLLLLLLLLH